MSSRTTQDPSATSPDATRPEVTHPSHHQQKSDLSVFETESNGRLPFILTVPEMKLLGIAGVGFFLDAYDLFIINPVTTMLQFRLYGGGKLPAGLEGFVKASANIGSVLGQFIFGYSADYFGRKAVYGKELMLIIVATILCISDPTGVISPGGTLIWLAVFRILLGIGVGGDYPMSAAVVTDRANVRRRGVLLAFVFANQGWGSLVGSLVTIIVLACYRHVMEVEGEISKVDGVWRIVVGFSLIPAFGTLYQRLTLPEAKRYTEARENNFMTASADDEESLRRLKAEHNGSTPPTVIDPQNEKGAIKKSATPTSGSSTSMHGAVASKRHITAGKKAHWSEFFAYFSEWRHAKQLIGTCVCWFLLDIAFYGVNLNQNVVLQQIGFDGKSGTPWNRLFKIGLGNLIITALGFVPGYYVTVLTIEKLGRKWIQIQGFLLEALFLAILAGRFHSLSKVSFIVCFAFLQFFFNFGANATTYCYPAEIFPTKFRATAHGVSAACGKAGAIISALGFNSLSNKIGTPAVLWIFFGCCIGGAVFTLFLPEVKGRDPDLVFVEEQMARS